jgi:signal transduction histidine kinase
VVLRNVPPPLPLDFAMTLLIAAVVGIALLSIPLTRSMLRPLHELIAVTRAYAGGDTSARARLRRKDEFGDLAEAFNHMIDRVDLMRRSEKQLLANVSHELRTPLARVRVLLELGSDGAPGQAYEVLPEIAQDLAELERLVDDVLTTVRLDLATSGNPGTAIEMPMHFEQHDVADIVRRWQERFARQHPSRELVVECASSLPTLRCDPVLLRRAVDNLLDNAARYTSSGPIELRVNGEAGTLRIEVVDHGPGIAAADLERVFEPFYRVEESRDRRLGGVGLGLPLAKRIIEAHGGHITLHSTVNVGTRAVADLPI